MKRFLSQKIPFLLLKSLRHVLLSLCLLTLLVFGGACQKSVDYFSYVSELRSNLFLGKTEQFSLRVYSVHKESPYLADGIKRECVTRTEIHLVAPSGNENCHISFTVDGEEYAGDASFDNVKGEYYYAYPVDISALQELDIFIEYGKTQTTLTARSVLTPDTLSPQTALQTLVSEEKELFDSLTDEYGFAGEIHLRLLYEGAPYYYIGIADRNGNTYAFLMNAVSGKILAKRQS